MCWPTKRCWPLPLHIPQFVHILMLVQCGSTAGLCHQLCELGFLAWKSTLSILFIYMLLGSMTIRSPTSFSVADREAISARLHIYKQDLIDEISHFKAFSKVNDQAWMVSEGVLAHVRSVVGLRFPLNPGYSFVRAPEWTTVPRSIQESKVYFKMA